jgi:LacI family transcriptional regulator
LISIADSSAERAPRLRDVAARAGVSTSMASRILSGARAHEDAKREAVLQAARELAYRPNLVARSLRAQATRMVGMVVPEISNPFFPQLIEAVARDAGDQGRTLLLADACGDPQLELRQVEALVDRRVDGLIIVPVDRRASAPAVRRAAEQVPTVQLDRRVTGAESHVVTCDNAAGMRAVVTHVAARGADAVLVSGGAGSSTGVERQRGFEEACAEAGLAARPALLGDFDAATGRRAARALLAEGPLPGTIVCGADLIALGVLEELRAAGVAVPEETAVTGFDDIAFAALAVPALTTVRQPVEDLAATAIELLDRSDRPHRHVRLQPELVVRASCPAAPSPAVAR